jgi:hypothetical protein
MNRTTSVVTSLRFKHAVSLRLDPVGSSAGVLVPQPSPFACSRSVAAKWAGVQALCFGDFHLGPQMKVTRLSGRDPTRCIAGKKHFAEATKQRPIAKTIP